MLSIVIERLILALKLESILLNSIVDFGMYRMSNLLCKEYRASGASGFKSVNYLRSIRSKVQVRSGSLCTTKTVFVRFIPAGS